MSHLRVPTLVLLALGGVAAAGASRPAHAGGGPTFEFLCGTFVDGEVKDVVPSPKKPKITDPIGCALRVTDAPEGWEENWMVTLAFARHIGGARTATDSGSKSGSFTRDANNVVDVEWEVKPTDMNADAGPFFKTCEDFDVGVHVYTDMGDVGFEKTFKVAQKCPKPKPPKPIAAKVTCTATAQDGTRVPITSKRRGRYGLESTVSCIVVPKAKRAQVGNLAVTGHIDHTDDNGQPASSPVHEAEVVPIDEGTWLNFQVDFQGSDWMECGDGTIILEGRNDNGELVLNQKLPFKQDCPD